MSSFEKFWRDGTGLMDLEPKALARHVWNMSRTYLVEEMRKKALKNLQVDWAAHAAWDAVQEDWDKGESP